MSITFGNGLPLIRIAQEANELGVDGFKKKYGDAFLLLDDVSAKATGDVRTISKITGPRVATPAVIFVVVKKAMSKFDFVSVGRHEDNDIHLPEASVSRFHAYLRQTGDEWFVQDAGSANGSDVEGQKVPAQGKGQPLLVKPGTHIGFGDVRATFVTAALFVELARNVLSA